MAKHKDSRLKLPGDFLGTVRALLNTPPPKDGRTVRKPMADKALIERLAKAWLAEAKRLQERAACSCGCGETVTARVRFKPGHDAKMLARYRREIAAILSGMAS